MTNSVPSLDKITTGLAGLGEAAIGYLGMDICQILVGIGLVFLALKLAKRAASKLVYMLVVAALYLISRGVLNMGTLLEWWNALPGIVEKLFMLGRSVF